MLKNDIGVIGMGVMGKNLAHNIANHGYQVSVFNRSNNSTINTLVQNPITGLFPFFSLKEFIFSLKKPRCILFMIKAGSPVDELILLIKPYLEHDDLIIDGGNSFFKDTILRCKMLKKSRILFLGAGISGGEEGALNGPAIMPGGTEEAYKRVSCIFKDISAKYKGESCVEYIGPNGSGHYVKMVHNGIEYSDMELIAESYFLLKKLLGVNNQEMSDIFCIWNTGELSSYLIEITGHILSKKNSQGIYELDRILDEASQKGTGMWTAQSALELHTPLSVITESVFIRYLSALRAQRFIASTVLKGPDCVLIDSNNKKEFIEDIRKALFLGKIISYAQGFNQMKEASQKYLWNLNFSNIAKIFRAGCIIRANFLNDIMTSFSKNNDVINLLLTPYFQDVINLYQQSLRRVIITATKNGIAVPVFSSALSYYDSYRTVNSSANLIQAQRDYFGSHTYKRIDEKGSFHTDWIH
ncbi:6-phosphogluconate dehydrogenase [Buchnera aphidicola (Cinara tujafilina)]|uniref:6-phosphogluconate dehydrogenase, decarboxylating n=2 Tax=Buchnera TaxID=32199 RepID=F7WZ14_9GAMM|nr:NADP-dependent phosphogluconate dehydrogenase [Buchnera aphidicola]AEH39664.1 6-phosphogluconate dehydrogenase [Buchnera aphidicola (Cinara tujafilina)]